MQIQSLHFFPGPGRFTQELQAGLDAGLILKAIDIDVLGEAFPAVYFYQVFQNSLQGFAVQGIVGLGFHHGIKVACLPSLHSRQKLFFRASAWEN